MDLLIKNRVFQVIIYKGENLLCLHVKRDAIELPVSPSVELFRNIGEFGAKNISQTIEQLHTIQLFWSILFLDKSQRRGIP